MGTLTFVIVTWGQITYYDILLTESTKEKKMKLKPLFTGILLCAFASSLTVAAFTLQDNMKSLAKFHYIFNSKDGPYQSSDVKGITDYQGFSALFTKIVREDSNVQTVSVSIYPEDAKKPLPPGCTLNNMPKIDFLKASVIVTAQRCAWS